jgi:hypothetical protein
VRQRERDTQRERDREREGERESGKSHYIGSPLSACVRRHNPK